MRHVLRYLFDFLALCAALYVAGKAFNVWYAPVLGGVFISLYGLWCFWDGSQ